MAALPIQEITDAHRPARIYQVELSSYCNMACSYCPHPGMERLKGHMSREVLAVCIDWIRSSGGDRIVLHHFGEPLLHPHLRERLEQVAASGLKVQLSTNALLLERAWPTLTAVPAPISVMISIHQWAARPEADYAAAIERWRQRAEGTNVSILEAYNLKGGHFTFHRWARGEVDGWDARRCPFVRLNLGVVLWNGDIAACCVDHEGVTARFNILRGGAREHVSRIWSACASCDVGRIMRDEEW